MIVCEQDPQRSSEVVEPWASWTCDREAAAFWAESAVSFKGLLPGQPVLTRQLQQDVLPPSRVSRAAGGAEGRGHTLCPGWVGAPAPGKWALLGHVPALESMEAVPSVLGVFWVLPAQAYCSTLGRLFPVDRPPPLSR